MNAENWLDQYGDFLYNFAMIRIGNNARLAEDLVQETFLSALKTDYKYEGKSSERTWLVSILKNKIIDYYRKNKGNLFIQDNFQTEEFKQEGSDKGTWNKEYAPTDWGSLPDDALDQKEFMIVLKKCIKQLPENISAVFSLRELDGLDSETICKELSITSSNLWVMLHRARTGLRRCLEINWLDIVK